MLFLVMVITKIFVQLISSGLKRKIIWRFLFFCSVNITKILILLIKTKLKCVTLLRNGTKKGNFIGYVFSIKVNAQ